MGGLFGYAAADLHCRAAGGSERADSGGAASGAGSAWVGDGYVFNAAGVAGLVNHKVCKAAFAVGGDRVWVWAPASCCQIPRNRRGSMPKSLLGGAVESMTKTRLGWMSGLQRERPVKFYV